MATDGNRIEVDEKDARYLLAYFEQRNRNPLKCEPWMSTICQECGNTPHPEGYPHIIDPAGMVLICCEGYHQINPNSIGIPDDVWMDWHEEIGGLEPELPEELHHLTVECIRCQTPLGKCQANGGQCCNICIHAEGP